MNNFSFILAWRYLRAGQQDTSIKTMLRICFFGILIGACSLTLVLCIMHGFEQATRQKLQSLNPTIMIRSTEAPLNVPAIKKVLESKFPTITASAPTMQQFVMIQEPHTKALSTIVTLKAIDPAQEQHVTALAHMLQTPINQRLEKILHDNHILLGAKMAQQLKLKVCDTITIFYSPDQERTSNLQHTTVIIGGLFNTGIEEFDLNLLVAHLDFARKLFPDQGIDEIGLSLAPAADQNKVVAELKNRFIGLDIVTWHDLYPALVAALKLEKYAVFFVVMLISLVACMNIISLLFMFITHKRRDIAILKAYGVTDATIARLFFWIGLLIGLAGATCGLMLAWLVGMLLKLFPFIKLPDVYYATYLPIELDFNTFALVFGTVVLLTMLATLIPLRGIKRASIAEVLRFEG